MATAMPRRFLTLIVDDDPLLLDGLRKVLHREPYDLVTVSGGEEALAMIAKRRPQVIVTDQHMPGMLGTELLARAKEIAPESARILVTGSPSLDVAVEAINRGAVTRMFIKPFQSMYLAMAIREAMEQVELALLARQLLARLRQSAVPAEEYEPLDAREILVELRREVGR